MHTLKNKEMFLLDMDGTLYLGDELIDGSRDFLETIRQKNKKLVFLTNNSSKSKRMYIDKLRWLGVDATMEEIFTSGEATMLYLRKENPSARVFLLGTQALEREFEEAGFELIRERGKEVDYVVLGFDTTLTYAKLWAACEYLADGVPYIATHPDFNCPLPGGRFMPDAGAMAALIEASTGKTPKVIGKPNKDVVESIAAKFGCEKEAMVMVGDRLYTDIQTGLNAGITTVLVYSGETTEEVYKTSTIRADVALGSVKDMIPLL